MTEQNKHAELNSDSLQEEIRLAAYYKWLLAGRPDGRHLDFWCEAEREYLAAQEETAHRDSGNCTSVHREVIVRPKALPAPAARTATPKPLRTARR